MTAAFCAAATSTDTSAGISSRCCGGGCASPGRRCCSCSPDTAPTRWRSVSRSCSGLKFELDIDPLICRRTSPTRGRPARRPSWRSNWRSGTAAACTRISPSSAPTTTSRYSRSRRWRRSSTRAPGRARSPRSSIGCPNIPASIQARYSAPFIVNGGEYRFALELYVGTATLLIDGVKRNTNGREAVQLGPGLHQLEVNGAIRADGGRARHPLAVERPGYRQPPGADAVLPHRAAGPELRRRRGPGAVRRHRPRRAARLSDSIG